MSSEWKNSDVCNIVPFMRRKQFDFRKLINNPKVFYFFWPLQPRQFVHVWPAVQNSKQGRLKGMDTWVYPSPTLISGICSWNRQIRKEMEYSMVLGSFRRHFVGCGFLTMCVILRERLLTFNWSPSKQRGRINYAKYLFYELVY